MDSSNLYILTSFAAAIFAFFYLSVGKKLNLSPKTGVCIVSFFGSLMLLPALFGVDYESISLKVYIYIFCAGVFRLLGMVKILEVTKKTSVERFSAINPVNIFVSFLIYAIIDYENTIKLMDEPVKFFGIIASICALVGVLILRKKDKNFTSTNDAIVDFIEFYFTRYKAIGQELDTSDKKENYIK